MKCDNEILFLNEEKIKNYVNSFLNSYALNNIF